MPKRTSPERWRPIAGYEGHYEVSDHGRVRSVERVVTCRDGVEMRVNGCIRKIQGGGRRYPQVMLCRGSVTKMAMVHHLVLEAFVAPRPSPDAQGLHWDDNRWNNHFTNLRWGNYSENIQDRLRNGLHPQANRTHCPRNHPLKWPNLVRSELGRRNGGRDCFACSRARTLAADYVRKGWAEAGTIDLQRLSDIYYAHVIKTNGAPGAKLRWASAGRSLPLLPEADAARHRAHRPAS